MKLRPLWTLKLKNKVESIAFSDKGTLGITSDRCAFIVNEKGELISRICGKAEMFGASFNKLFGFMNVDDYAYLVLPEGKLEKRIFAGEQCNESITMLEDSFIACRYKCALIDLHGQKRWVTEVGHVPSGPAVKEGVVYAPDEEKLSLLLMKLNNGEIIKEIDLGEEAYDAKVCGDKLVVGTASTVRIFDVSDPLNPKPIKRIEGFLGAWSVAFPSSCDKIAVADFSNFTLKVFDLNGNLLWKKVYEIIGSEEIEGIEVHSVAWKDDRIAVGLRDGTVYLYEVSE
ncbi:hypothetical protein IPA_01475 [Ignicoccus pacificus DSM 13166]|uniref:Uncharacterized protein n=1 Tax=Ignicoccus pacificus DSM 13166 TaxID=940294 RepID=A0A977PKJ4_9CREN|nr:hypothetical protein IPA_01475 [Ignicoccus pacificus DSM 13166]